MAGVASLWFASERQTSGPTKHSLGWLRSKRRWAEMLQANLPEKKPMVGEDPELLTKNQLTALNSNSGNRRCQQKSEKRGVVGVLYGKKWCCKKLLVLCEEV